MYKTIGLSCYTITGPEASILKPTFQTGFHIMPILLFFLLVIRHSRTQFQSHVAYWRPWVTGISPFFRNDSEKYAYFGNAGGKGWKRGCFITCDVTIHDQIRLTSCTPAYSFLCKVPVRTVHCINVRNMWIC